MRKNKKLFAFLLGACLMTQIFAAGMADAAGEEKASNENLPEAGEGDVVFLHTNDSHSRVDDYMGFAAVAALRKYYENQGAAVFLVDAGDALDGASFAMAEQGSSIVELMNLAGYDVMTPGNHDFSYGSERLLELRERMQFELVSANVFDKEDGSYFITPYILIERNGETYGFFGLSTPETRYKTEPDNIAGLDFGDPVQAARDMVDELNGRGAEHIIAVTHLGTDDASEVTSKTIAELVEGIDLIIDGHSHTVYENGYRVNDTMIVSTGAYIQNIGVVVQDADGYTASLVNAEQFQEKDETVTARIAAIKKQQTDRTQENEKTEDSRQAAGDSMRTGEQAHDAGELYTVIPGDYLRRLAEKFYGNESMWKGIYEANKDKISNPDLIFAGMELLIP